MKKSLHLITMLALVAVLGFASCNKEKTFTVTFNANGGTGTMAVQTFSSKEAQALAANAFTKEGFEFVNWNTMVDGSGDTYTDKQTVTLTENLTLYAQWRSTTPGTPEQLLKGKWTIQDYKVNGIRELSSIGQNWNFKEDGTFTGWLDVNDGVTPTHCNYTFVNNIVTLKDGELVQDDEVLYKEYRYKMYVDEISETVLELSGTIVSLDLFEVEDTEGTITVTLQKN